MKEVWVVICNGEVSSECYQHIGQAVEFILGRAHDPTPDTPYDALIWHDELSNEYKLKCLTIKEGI